MIGRQCLETANWAAPPGRRVLGPNVIGTLRIVAMAVLASCAQLSPEATPQPAPVADSWCLTLDYRQGYVAAPVQWGVTIGSEGLCQAWWKRWSGVHPVDPFDPTPEMRVKLRAAIDSADLPTMPALGCAGADTDALSVTLTDRTGVHVVVVGDVRGRFRRAEPEARDAIGRFFLLVAEVLRLQPSPIGWQTPENFEAWARGE